MDFKDSIIELGKRVSKQKDSIATEEATKNAFIMPMIAALGYDVFNPFEVVPELDCDLVKKKGEKIDYAIMRDGETVILIECKHCTQDLNLHDTQLQKYFVASKARFGILTNGIEYRFYTDLDKVHLMDERPFLIVDMLNLSDNDIEQLKKFHKSNYNESEILSTAQQLQISTSLRKVIMKDFQSPSQEFVRYFVREINDNRSSAKLVDQYTPLLKEEISKYINEVISERLNVAMKKEEKRAEESKETIEELPEGAVFADSESGVVTTQEELDAFNIVRSILRKDADVSRIYYTDFKTYFVVCIDKPSKWICRFYFRERKKQIAFPLIEEGKGEERLEIQSIDDIFNYSDKLIEILKARL